MDTWNNSRAHARETFHQGIQNEQSLFLCNVRFIMPLSLKWGRTNPLFSSPLTLRLTFDSKWIPRSASSAECDGCLCVLPFRLNQILPSYRLGSTLGGGSVKAKVLPSINLVMLAMDRQLSDDNHHRLRSWRLYIHCDKLGWILSCCFST